MAILRSALSAFWSDWRDIAKRANQVQVRLDLDVRVLTLCLVAISCTALSVITIRSAVRCICNQVIQRWMRHKTGSKPGKLFRTDDFWGYKFGQEFKAAAARGQIHEHIRQNFHKAGPTFRTPSFEYEVIHTIDNANLLRIFNEVDVFGKAPRKDGGWFAPSWAPFLKSGMMVSDGEEWRMCRGCVRTVLDKKNLGQLDKLEPFVEKLLVSLCQDGAAEVDLQPRLIDFSKDAVLGFLMGLDAEVAGAKWASIRAAADYCSEVIYWRFRKIFIQRCLVWNEL